MTPINTAVGAVAGALPVLIGWSATGEPLDERALALVLMLFLWQFPHFMAIAWLYREHYARAGHQMLTVVDPTGRRAGRQAVLAALALDSGQHRSRAGRPDFGQRRCTACSPRCWASASWLLAVVFRSEPSDWRARLLLRASLVYLPTLLAMLMLVPWL